MEGIVCKKPGQRYRPGARAWTKIRLHDTTEAIIGAITGTFARPQLLVLGRHDQAGHLHGIGCTTRAHHADARRVPSVREVNDTAPGLARRW
ncbi:hypothetical protein [Streptomyces sp. LN699]|uniref:hypothetical protein n=1 Tax=Streptomyces sp. LN699 TaxID=3112981 RepID=UPI00372397F9